MDVLFRKVTQIDRIFEIPALKRRYKRLNQDPLSVIKDLETNKNFGFSIMNAGGLLLGALSVLIFSLILLLKGFYDFEFPEKEYLIFIILIPAYLACYFFVFRKDKYLIYFTEFEKWTKFKKRKNIILSASFIVGTTAFFFWSLLRS